MPWNEPGRGGNGKDPWKGGGSQQPPDLDEVFANVQKRLKKIMGGGGGASGGGSSGPSFAGIGGILVVLALIWMAWTSIHIVDESERGVVLRFGEHVRVLGPGLNFTLPAPIEELHKVNVTRVRSLESSSRMLTGDENLIDLDYAVQYRVLEPENFLFNVREPEVSLAHASDSSIREIVGTNNMDFILEIGRGQVATDARELTQEIVDRYQSGIEVTSFNLQDVKPPMQVQEAFDDVVMAREDQIRFANEAQAYANKEIPEARGRAARVLEQAEGYRESIIAEATGDADRFVALYEEYAQAPEVTRERLYLQTLERVYGRSMKVLIDVTEGNNLFYVPLDRMGASQAPVPPAPLLSQAEREQRQDQSESRSRRGREGR